MLRTIHILAPGPTGGAETVAQNLAHGLIQQGDPATIAALVPDDQHPYVVACEARGIRVIPICENPRKYWRQARRIADAARETNSHVIHTHGFLADVMGNWGGEIAKLPVVSTLHGFTVAGRRAYLYDLPARWAHKHANAVVAVSESVVTRLRSRGVRPERIHLLPNAWYSRGELLDRAEARRQIGVPTDGFRVGWIGRLTPEKGGDVFINAIAALRDTNIRVSLLGDGPDRAELEAFAASRGVTDAIRWHGMVPFAERYLKAFDLLVMSSRTEGTPMVLLEAMAAGIPIVTTGVGGIPQMLSPNEAILVESERPDALAAAIRQSFDDESSARRRAEAARERLDRDFSATSWINRHRDLYRSVVSPSIRV